MKRFMALLVLLLVCVSQACASGPQAVVGTSPVGFPAPPPGSQTFTSLQNATGTPGTWIVCDGTCSGSTPGETGTSSFTQSIASPSLSGSSAEQQSAGTTSGDFWNTLYTIKIVPSFLTGGVCSGVTGLDMDLWVYVPSGNVVEAYEFDPDLWCSHGGTAYKYMASLQYAVRGSNAGWWRVYQTGTGWVTTTYPATQLTVNTWHHLQLHASFNQSAQTYTYGAFFVDGSPISTNLNITYSAVVYTPAGAGEVQSEHQIDGYSTPQNNKAYYDNETLTVEY